MAKPSPYGPNQYNSTPRKIFDRHVDQMETKRKRDRDDHRADLKALIGRLQNLETHMANQHLELEEMREHIDRHCAQLDTSRGADKDA